MQTIVLFGVKGSGKDTVGAMLRERYGFVTDSFADPLKRMAKIAFPAFTDEDLWGPSENRERQYKQYPMGDRCLKCNEYLYPPLGDTSPDSDLECTRCFIVYPRYVNPRIALQMLGTEWGRRLYEDVWIDNVFARVEAARQITHPLKIDRVHYATPGYDYRPYVITDGRYPNEQARSAKLGATTVLLLRKLEESTSTHSSESSLKTIPREAFQYVLDNRCPLEELPALVDTMVKTLGIAR